MKSKIFQEILDETSKKTKKEMINYANLKLKTTKMKEKKQKKPSTIREKFLTEFKIYFDIIFGENKNIERNEVKKFLISLTFIKIMEKCGWVNAKLLPTLFEINNELSVQTLNELTNLNISNTNNFFKSKIFSENIGFLSFLNNYVYSAKELTDKDIITPEILSNIFEGMLEDTKKNGTTYTPKEIVEYMCQSSLIESLKTNFPDVNIDLIDNIFKNDVIDLPADILTKMISVLDSQKICDPAIGCGVFPLGMINEISKIKEKIQESLNKEFNSYDVKKGILEKNIYGVDIEGMGIFISHLRLNLFLNCDETNFKGFVNLDYKIVKGNSLINIIDDKAINIDWNIKEEDNELQSFLINALKENYYYQQKYFSFKGSLSEKNHVKTVIYENKLVIISKILIYNNANLANSGFQNKKDQLDNLEKMKSNEYLLDKISDYLSDNSKYFEFFDWTLDFAHIQNPLLFIKQ